MKIIPIPSSASFLTASSSSGLSPSSPSGQPKEDHAFILDLGTGDYLEIFETSQPFSLGKWQHVAIWTDDMEKSYRRALKNGAKVSTQPAISHIPTRSGQIVHMKFGFLEAPGGEIVELIQDVPADAHL